MLIRVSSSTSHGSVMLLFPQGIRTVPAIACFSMLHAFLGSGSLNGDEGIKLKYPVKFLPRVKLKGEGVKMNHHHGSGACL